MHVVCKDKISSWYLIGFPNGTISGINMGAGYFCHRPKQFFLLFQRVITGAVPKTFRRYIITSGSPKLAISGPLSRRLQAMRARVGRLEVSPTPSPYSWFFSQACSRPQSGPPVRSSPPPTVRRWRSNRPGPRVARLGCSSPCIPNGRPGFRISMENSPLHARLPQVAPRGVL